MTFKRLIIKGFLKRYNRDSISLSMPIHLWHRWYGIDGQFYNSVWKYIGADEDEFVFDDFCDISFDIKHDNFDSLKNLKGMRLKRLYSFSWRMLTHYLIVTAFWKTGEALIKFWF